MEIMGKERQRSFSIPGYLLAMGCNRNRESVACHRFQNGFG
jgi:hypothetical protein